MSEKINMNSSEAVSAHKTEKTSPYVIEIADGLLFDARADLRNKKNISMPIAELATLGAGVASLLPAFRTVTQTTTINSQGLYQLANAGVGDTLKMAKNGNFWGAVKTADGASKLAQLQSAGPLAATTTTVAALNPAVVMMAVALFSIEQKLGDIEEAQKQILSFLEIEKESEIEGDVEMLSDIFNKYKYNWDNEHYVTSSHKIVMDIQRTARKNMNGYQKKVAEVLGARQLIVMQNQVNSTQKDLLKKFKYYRLSLYTFAMASLMEIMLSGNFKEEYITGVKDEIVKMSSSYRQLFSECSAHLEKMSKESVGTNVLKGIGGASKAFGTFIGSIPIVKEGPVDEFLQDSGAFIESSAKEMEKNVVSEFAQISSPETHIFTDKMMEMIQIYNHTERICFDDNMIYLVAG